MHVSGTAAERLATLALRQHGVFARRQALELGFTSDMIARRVDRNEWRRVIGSVLTAATTRLDSPGMEWAAYLAAGPGAVLSGPSALRRHGIEPGMDQRTWVTVPPERHVTFGGVRTIREVLRSDDVVTVDGMCTTTALRSIIDTLRVLPEQVTEAMLDRALLRGLLTVEDLASYAEQFAGRRGVRRLRRHLERVATGARSHAERRLHELLTGEGLDGWVANVRVFDDSEGLRAVLDVAFAEAKVAVEIDGLAFHVDPEHFQRDRSRQNWLVNNGWAILRFTWDDLTRRPGMVIATIRNALNTHSPVS
jgi:very-short-patch-repair endonuclease